SVSMKKRTVASALMVLVMLAAIGGPRIGATSAVFTDSASSSGNTFSSGTVILSTSGSITFTSPAMHPGDLVVAPITVSNTGTLGLKYALVSTTTEDTLAAALQLTVKTGVTTCTAAG